MLQIDTCKLCHQVKPLLNKSHIIPEFMYDILFDEHHKMNKLNPGDYLRGTGHIVRPPTGEYESGILCEECDNIRLGSLETYAKGILNLLTTKGCGCEDMATPEGIDYTCCKNVEYKSFKLFLLSILWRASISKREFFKEVKLGPYEDVIRLMLYDGDPRKEEDFPVIMATWLNDESWGADLVGQPGKNRSESGIRYVFIIAGVTYIYYVSPNILESMMRPYVLSRNNEAFFLHIPKGRLREFYQMYFHLK